MPMVPATGRPMVVALTASAKLQVLRESMVRAKDADRRCA